MSKTMMFRLCGAVGAALLTATGAAAQPKPLPPLPADAPPPFPGRSLEGTWIAGGRPGLIAKDKDGQPVPLNAEGRKILDRRQAAEASGTPFVNASAVCRPPGPTWQMDLNFPFEVHEVGDRLEFIFEEYHGVRTIFFDPAKAPTEPRYHGRSIGRWEGDTLVVETTGFKQPLWLDTDGTPASTDAKLTEVIRKVNDGRWYMEVVYTLDDPKYYTRPWSWTKTYLWRPDRQIFLEYNCEEQTGDPNYVAQSGLVREPE